MARPSKLTPEVQENICNWLKLGYYQEDAAIMAGISASTYYEWMKKGEQERVALEEGEKALTLPDTSLPASEDGTPEIELIYPFLEFSEAVKKARAEAEGAHIRNIRKAADNGVWQASAWFLERAIQRSGESAHSWTLLQRTMNQSSSRYHTEIKPLGLVSPYIFLHFSCPPDLHYKPINFIFEPILINLFSIVFFEHMFDYSSLYGLTY